MSNAYLCAALSLRGTIINTRLEIRLGFGLDGPFPCVTRFDTQLCKS